MHHLERRVSERNQGVRMMRLMVLTTGALALAFFTGCATTTHSRLVDNPSPEQIENRMKIKLLYVVATQPDDRAWNQKSRSIAERVAANIVRLNHLTNSAYIVDPPAEPIRQPSDLINRKTNIADAVLWLEFAALGHESPVVRSQLVDTETSDVIWVFTQNILKRTSSKRIAERCVTQFATDVFHVEVYKKKTKSKDIAVTATAAILSPILLPTMIIAGSTGDNDLERFDRAFGAISWIEKLPWMR